MIDIFDMVGPIMVGPSSSHTAGAVRIGRMARTLFGGTVQSANILLHGSFLETGRGHGTDKALVAGLLGMKPDDLRIPDSFALAEKEGLSFSFGAIVLKNAHPNSVRLELHGISDGEPRTFTMEACSVGGGQIMVTAMDGVKVSFSGAYNTLIIQNRDDRGYIADVTTTLSRARVNIANMNLCRDMRGGKAIMVIETDEKVPEVVLQFIREFTGVLHLTYYEKEDA